MKKIIILLFVLSLVSCKSKTNNDYSKISEPKTDLVTEKMYLELGGESQYVEISSSSSDNPILLFIHGGPAWPQTPQLRYYSSELTNKYTLVIWEQRGAGNSYKKNSEPDNLTLEQIIKDGHELTDWLKNNYNQQKIYLAGYSWGSLIGIDLISKYPEDYKAYIGISQIINMDKGMLISQNWLKEQIIKADDTKALNSLDSLKYISNYTDELDRFFQQWTLLNKYRGATYNQASEKETEKAMSFYEDYKDYDWFKVWEQSSKKLQNDWFTANTADIDAVKVPVFLLEGRHDWNIPSVLAEEWLDKLQAPKKKLYWFENSGHGCLEEEPQEFNKVMFEIFEEVEKEK